MGGSSEPSEQSLCPSHFHQIGIHLQGENIPHSKAPREGKTEFQVMTRKSSRMALEEDKVNLGYCVYFQRKQLDEIEQVC